MGSLSSRDIVLFISSQVIHFAHIHQSNSVFRYAVMLIADRQVRRDYIGYWHRPFFLLRV